MPELADLSVLLQPSISEPCTEVHRAAIHAVARVRGVAGLPVHHLGEAADNQVFPLPLLLLINEHPGLCRPELPSRDPHRDLSPGLNVNVLAQRLFPRIDHHPHHGIFLPQGLPRREEVLQHRRRHLSLRMEELAEGLDEGEILHHQLSHLRQQEPDGPAGGIAAVPVLVIAEDEEHLAVMQKEIPCGQRQVPPPQHNELGPSSLLAGPQEDQHQNGTEEPLHTVLILLCSISQDHPPTLHRGVPLEEGVQKHGCPTHAADQPRPQGFQLGAVAGVSQKELAR
ncbi:hypothetical protein EMCG_01648 [[Emmonsia] crescens]|uniref:Uncharacterized protein n=1 Tax=[Emmonsia] crescens TaxID=73230 RepID=A0A0G2J9I6_9EURO|nr:hypothetical protein EMCG_01648 [Emmonsia crescens UAMH 3008]